MAMDALVEPGADLSGSPVTGWGQRFTPSSGMVVALVGPDGVGKSSQTAQLTGILRQNYKCTAIYLGSGDGGWKFRRIAKRHLRKWGVLRPPRHLDGEHRSTSRDRGTSHSILTGLAGLVVALERYVMQLRAMRLAASGSIVISDRWPQNLQPGLFDGPLHVHPRASRTVRWLSRIERGIYRKMEACKPQLTIHLVSDFETSNARKPGDRTRAEFHQRLSLMQDMRALDPAIRMVDARNEFDEVTKELSNWISLALSERRGGLAEKHLVGAGDSLQSKRAPDNGRPSASALRRVKPHRQPNETSPRTPIPGEHTNP